MPPKKLKPSSKTTSCSTDSPWLRCPRSPCLVSYRPKNARRHLATCRYFSCSNHPCNFLGTQKQVNVHESGCPYGLRSEEIGTTDPLSDSPSEVLDILTSPNRVHSYPTAPSSGVSPVSSRKKPVSTRQRALEKPRPCDGSPVQGSSKLTEELTHSTVTITARRPADPRSTIDPYDPSAKRIFSLPADAIDPDLRPLPPPNSKCSSPVPPPPTRRLATYELQRYRPEPQSVRRPPTPLTDTKCSSDFQQEEEEDEDAGVYATLARKTAQLEALQECYSALYKSFDDMAYSISQRRTTHELEVALTAVPLDDFGQVLLDLAQDKIPDRVFLEDMKKDAFEQEKQRDDDDDQREKENRRHTITAARRNSRERSSSAGYDPQEQLTTRDELATQVRQKIASAERKITPFPDSPSNMFGRKRKRPIPHDDAPDPARPTRFMHKLADTTIDLGDEIQLGLPPCCNLNKLIHAARTRIQSRLDLRDLRLDAS